MLVSPQWQKSLDGVKSKNKIIGDWLLALTSGEYKQIRKVYQDSSGGYCALGLLAHVAGVPIQSDMTPYFVDLIGNELKREVIAMNDRGASFVEIADFVAGALRKTPIE